MRFGFGILGIFAAISLLFVLALGLQESKIIEGTIQGKSYQEKKCTMISTFDPALNMVLPKENCEGPYWIITINNEQYRVTKSLYNKLEIDSFYSFSYQPLKGMTLLNE